MYAISLFPKELTKHSSIPRGQTAEGRTIAPGAAVLGARRVLGSLRSADCDQRSPRIESDQRASETRGSRSTIPTSIWSARHDGALAFIDDREPDFNDARDDRDGGGWFNAVHPDDRPRTLARWSAALRTGQPFHDMHRALKRCGRYEQFLVDGVAMRDEDGCIVCWIGAKTAIDDAESNRAGPTPEPSADAGNRFFEILSAAADAALTGSARRLNPKLFRDSRIQPLLEDLSGSGRKLAGLAPLYSHCVCVAVLARIGGRLAIERTDAQRRRIAPLLKWRLARVIQYIDAHIEEPIRLANLAKAAGLTRMHFAAQFRATVGMSPHEYLMRRRISRAQALLQDPKQRLVDVALSVGFQAQPHFTTVFQRYVGESPHRWRLSQSANRDERSLQLVARPELPPAGREAMSSSQLR